MMKKKTIQLGGVTFRWANRIEWQDAFKCVNEPFERVAVTAKKFKQTSGWYAKVNGNLLICNEKDVDSEHGDFTVVPLKAEIRIVR